tara:strand:+ start:3877 stop:4122 length:246 start_codon:yes stop_codon:yes gene_type:complete
MRKSGVCPKCGSKDLGVERDFRLPGREFLKIISCNKCKFVELYTIDNDERERKIRSGNIFLWSMMIIGFVIPISVILLFVI